MDAVHNTISQLVMRMSFDAKVRLLSGSSFWSVGPEPQVGLARMVLSDGPAGVRGEKWDERDPSLNSPAPIALAATWNPDIVRAVASLLAADAKRKGVHVVLAPGVNLQRHPGAGRNFEYMGEEPRLTGEIASAFVRGLQQHGVAATAKHLVANDSETERFTVDAHVDERTLHELYLLPFRMAVRAGVWAVMAAYNGVNGIPMTEHPLLDDPVRDAWGFDGVVMSDWFATRTVIESARGGLDLVMPGPATPWADGLIEAVRNGDVAESTIDAKVRRVLLLAARVGCLPQVSDVSWPPPPDLDSAPAVLRRASSESMVLLRNQTVLPLPPATSLGLVGRGAREPRVLGGGSCTVFPQYIVSPEAALRARYGDEKVSSTAGVRVGQRCQVAEWRQLRSPAGDEGVAVSFHAADGRELDREVRRNGLLKWLGDFTPRAARQDTATVTVSATFVAPGGGRYRMGFSGIGDFTLRVGDASLTESVAPRPDEDPIAALIRPPQRTIEIEVEEGALVPLTLTHAISHTGHSTRIELNIERVDHADEHAIEAATALARSVDVPIVFVETGAEVESESMDRSSLGLPGRQDDLVRAVAAANRRTVVVINAGAPVLLPWADEVSAIVVVWFAGQEYGNALGDVLAGAVDPGGRLPMTWPRVEGLTHPDIAPTDGVLTYRDGLNIGYRSDERRRVNQLYPFGFGLSLARWATGELTVESSADGWRVHGIVTNVGDMAGKHVLQAYATAPGSGISRPDRWLVGHTTVHADPGVSTPVVIDVPASAVAHYDVKTRTWIVEDTRYELLVGAHADDESAQLLFLDGSDATHEKVLDT